MSNLNPNDPFVLYGASEYARGRAERELELLNARFGRLFLPTDASDNAKLLRDFHELQTQQHLQELEVEVENLRRVLRLANVLERLIGQRQAEPQGGHRPSEVSRLVAAARRGIRKEVGKENPDE
jgi:hypothetical protein